MLSLKNYIVEARHKEDLPQEPLLGAYKIGLKFQTIDKLYHSNWIKQEDNEDIKQIWQLVKISKKGTTGTVKLLSTNGKPNEEEYLRKIKFECRWWCKNDKDEQMTPHLKKWMEDNKDNLSSFLRDYELPHIYQWIEGVKSMGGSATPID